PAPQARARANAARGAAPDRPACDRRCRRSVRTRQWSLRMSSQERLAGLHRRLKLRRFVVDVPSHQKASLGVRVREVLDSVGAHAGGELDGPALVLLLLLLTQLRHQRLAARLGGLVW